MSKVQIELENWRINQRSYTITIIKQLREVDGFYQEITNFATARAKNDVTVSSLVNVILCQINDEIQKGNYHRRIPTYAWEQVKKKRYGVQNEMDFFDDIDEEHNYTPRLGQTLHHIDFDIVTNWEQKDNEDTDQIISYISAHPELITEIDSFMENNKKSIFFDIMNEIKQKFRDISNRDVANACHRVTGNNKLSCENFMIIHRNLRKCIPT